MFPTTSTLVQKEYTAFQNNPPWGIELFPLKDDNIFEFVAKMKGLRDTIWEGGLFQIYIKFDENYNSKPPALCFHTIPFHPNIDAITGEPCIDYLQEDKWNKDFSLSFLLLSVQSLLSNPNLRNAVNLDALDMIDKSPKRYRQVVAECIAASNKLEEQYRSEIERSENKKKYIDEMKPVKTAHRKISKLSFEDYYTTWCGIATSKSKEVDTNPLLEQLRDKPELQKTHMALRPEDIEEQIKKQIEEHTLLMYGKFDSNPTVQDEKEAKLAKLQQMKKIYLPPRVSPSPTSEDIILSGSVHASLHGKEPSLHGKELSLHGKEPSLHGKEEEPWENEVDDLVAWTNNLDTNAIDT